LLGYTLSTVEDIFGYHHFHQLTDVVVLDVKSWLPTQYSNMPGYWLTLAEEIVRLSHVYDMDAFVHVECENALVLNRVKKLSSIKTFLTVNCDLENGMRKALKENYTGISHRADCDVLDKDDMGLMHRKGLRLHLWVVNSDDDKTTAHANEVDFIQTDNP
jgi:glycerophosphoryl diester phosphodiesterase